ncbi:hypothetical protein MUGA111182_19395 [Mucilaginibacter galii]
MFHWLLFFRSYTQYCECILKTMPKVTLILMYSDLHFFSFNYSENNLLF